MGLGATTGRVVRTKGFLDDPHTAAEQVWEALDRQAAPNGMRSSLGEKSVAVA